jgi:hypothetical protein
MKIIVDNKLTYECSYSVNVGDIVVVPAPWFLQDNGPTTTGKVTKLGSDYSGHVISVLSVK